MRGFSVLLVVLFGVFFPVAAEENRLLFSADTEWGKVLVRQQGEVRRLLFAEDGSETEESRMSVRQPHRPLLDYVRQMLVATAVWQGRQGAAPQQILVVGLGGASLTNALAYHYPEATVTSIELEPTVVEAARRFFFYRESERVVTAVQDARSFLEQTSQRYDLIYLDAFAGLEVPASLRTVEFARLLDLRLQEGGAVIANIHFVPETPSLRYRRSLAEVFPHSLTLAKIAQGIGIYSRHRLDPEDIPAHAFDMELEGAIDFAPTPKLDNIDPYRDEPSPQP